MTLSSRALPAALFCLAATSLPAQSGTPTVMAPLANPDPRLAAIHAKSTGLHAPGQVAISPDGTLIAYTIGRREGATLHLISATNPDPAKEKLIAPNGTTACSNGAPVWSPDSQTLAYTSSCTSPGSPKNQDQLFLYSRATGESRQLTHLTGLFQQAAFSPDGKSLAFLFVENATRSAGALAAMTPWSGVIGQDNVEIQRVYSVPLASATGAFLTPANLHIYEFGWAPDSSGLTFVAANPPGENNWWVAKLYTESVLKPGEESRMRIEPHVVFDPALTHTPLKGLQIAVPRWSPDGKQIAFIGGLMSDQGSTGGDVWTVPATGGEPTDVTPNIDGSPTFLAWADPSTIGFVEERRGHDLITAFNVSSRTQVAQQDLGEVSVSGGAIKNAISVSSTGTLAFRLRRPRPGARNLRRPPRPPAAAHPPQRRHPLHRPRRIRRMDQ